MQSKGETIQEVKVMYKTKKEANSEISRIKKALA